MKVQANVSVAFSIKQKHGMMLGISYTDLSSIRPHLKFLSCYFTVFLMKNNGITECKTVSNTAGDVLNRDSMEMEKQPQNLSKKTGN